MMYTACIDTASVIRGPHKLNKRPLKLPHIIGAKSFIRDTRETEGEGQIFHKIWLGNAVCVWSRAGDIW